MNCHRAEESGFLVCACCPTHSTVFFLGGGGGGGRAENCPHNFVLFPGIFGEISVEVCDVSTE